MLLPERFLVISYHSKSFKELRQAWSKIVDHMQSLTEVAIKICYLKMAARLITPKVYYLIYFLYGGPEHKLSKLVMKWISVK